MITALPFSAIIANKVDPDQAFYLYEAGSSGKGLLCSIPLSCVNQSAILPHEQIYEDRAEALLQDFSHSHVQHNPILLITESPEFKTVIESISQNATLVSTKRALNEHDHSVWKVNSDQTIRFHGPLCIADGHHRFSALLKYYQAQKCSAKSSVLMAAVFAADQVSTRTKAVVVNNIGFSIETLQSKLDRFFQIKALPEPKAPLNEHDFSMVFAGNWYDLRLRSHVAREVKSQHQLGIEILKKYILQQCLNIGGYSQSSNVKVLFDPCNVTALLRNAHNSNQIAFVTASDPTHSIMRVAKQGRLLEANSTYFEPKMLNGIISLKL